MKILFGSIITSGRGKIGGQFVKRIRGGHSLSNLPSFKSKKYLLLNTRLSVTTFIFQKWQELDSNIRNDWFNIATTIQVPDKFGNLKYLTARQFFTKVSLQGWFNNQAIVSPDDFTTITGSYDAVFLDFSLDDENLRFNFTLHSDVASGYFRADKVASGVRTPRYLNSRILTVFNLSDSVTINFLDTFKSKYPSPKVGQYYNLSFVPFNEKGWLGTPVSFIVRVAL